MNNGFREHEEIRRIDRACIDAINDILTRMQTEYRKTHNADISINFKQASRVLGVKYFKNNLGRMKLEEALVEAMVRGGDSEVPQKEDKAGEV